MLKSENGEVKIKGKPYEICSDISTAIKAAKAAFAEDFGEEAAERMLKRACELGFKSDEEVDALLEKAHAEAMRKFNQGLMATLAKAMMQDD